MTIAHDWNDKFFLLLDDDILMYVDYIFLFG